MDAARDHGNSPHNSSSGIDDTACSQLSRIYRMPRIALPSRARARCGAASPRSAGQGVHRAGWSFGSAALLTRACRRKPGEVMAWFHFARVSTICKKRCVFQYVEPCCLPQCVTHNQRRQRSATAQTCPMSLSAQRSVGLQGKQGGSRTCRAQLLDPTALNKVISVSLHGILARAIDEQGTNRCCLFHPCGLQLCVLHKPRAIAV